MSEVARYWYEDINDDLDPYPPFKEGWVVAATDYDALAARLAEAERLLRGWCDHPHSYAMLRSTDKFLQQSTADSARPLTAEELGPVSGPFNSVEELAADLDKPDSAALSLSDYQCSSGRSAEDCMRWMSLSDGKAHCSRTDCTGPARISPIAKPDFWTIQD